MNDYCVTAPTRCEVEAPVEREMSTSEIIKEIRKELAETFAVLSQIRLSLDGEVVPDRKIEEPKCMNDEVKMIERMALDCMGISHCIHDRMFGRTFE